MKRGNLDTERCIEGDDVRTQGEDAVHSPGERPGAGYPFDLRRNNPARTLISPEL